MTRATSNKRVFVIGAGASKSCGLPLTNGLLPEVLKYLDDKKFQERLYGGVLVKVDPAKALFLFLSRLWFDLEDHPLHPGFDIRSYTSEILGTVLEVKEI